MLSNDVGRGAHAQVVSLDVRSVANYLFARQLQ
jgi:hypothetical protein